MDHSQEYSQEGAAFKQYLSCWCVLWITACSLALLFQEQLLVFLVGSALGLGSHLTLYRQGKAAIRQLRCAQSRAQSRQFGLPCVWESTSCPHGVCVADAICSQQHVFRSVGLQALLEGNVSIHCSPRLPEHRTNVALGRSSLCVTTCT